jgi:hypothetical protein
VELSEVQKPAVAAQICFEFKLRHEQRKRLSGVLILSCNKCFVTCKTEHFLSGETFKGYAGKGVK